MFYFFCIFVAVLLLFGTILSINRNIEYIIIHIPAQIRKIDNNNIHWNKQSIIILTKNF